MANATCGEPVVLNEQRSLELRSMAIMLGESPEALADRAMSAYLQERRAETRELEMFRPRRLAHAI